MISLNDQQLNVVMDAARGLRIQDRDAFLRLVARQLVPTPRDIDEAVRKALAYIRHHHDHLSERSYR
jgi:hypothetical protein